LFVRLEQIGRSGRPLPIENEAKAQGTQIEMKIVFMVQQLGDLVVISSGSGGCRERRLEVRNNVIAFDVNLPVMHQHWDQSARVDAEKPRPVVLVLG
jgi:hypothetical protein